MSFSSEIKEELMRQGDRARHCRLAELSAILRCCATVRPYADGCCRILLHTENKLVVLRCEDLIRRLFHHGPEVGVRRYPSRRIRYHLFLRSAKQAGPVLQAVRLTDAAGAPVFDPNLIHSTLLRKDCCRRAYLRGAFLSCGSVSDPHTSYHLELVCTDPQQAELIRQLICSLSLDARTVVRKKYHVVYLKEGDQIADLLGYMGARLTLLNLENVRILKEMRGSVNRRVNCETANINKTVNAAVRQIEDIKYIRSCGAMKKLPQELQEMAELRLQYPEASLLELGKLADPPLGKSGVNHRLRKISNIAFSMGKGQQGGYHD